MLASANRPKYLGGRTIVAAIIALSVLLVGFAGVAQAGPDMYCCGGGGGSSCNNEGVLISISNGQGSMKINGTNQYSNGDLVLLCIGVKYGISVASFNSAYTFKEWLSNAGSVGSSSQQSTTFTPTLQVSAPTLALILHEPAPPWAGYVHIGTGVTSVSGEFNVPSTTACSLCTRSVVYWVGIGGWGPEAFLQGGVYIGWYNYWYPKSDGTFGSIYTPNCTPCIQEWAEAFGSSGQPVQAWINNNFAPSVAQPITVTVSVSGTSSSVVIQAQNVNTYTAFWSGVPATNSGEWVEEDPSGAYPLPGNSVVTFYNPTLTDSGAYWTSMSSFAFDCIAITDGGHLDVQAASLEQFTTTQS